MRTRIAKLSCLIVNLLPYRVIEFLGRHNIHNERWIRYGAEVYTEVIIFGCHIAVTDCIKEE